MPPTLALTAFLAADAEVEVRAQRPAASASERQLDAEQLATLPGRSADELLRALPGLHIAAHGGRGKAWQFLLRGFDGGHGGDLAVRLEGVPLNEPSNTHGHGYLDLGLIPPLLVEGMTLRPGPFGAQAGDFATAGQAELSLGLAQPGGLVRAGAGSDRSGALTLAWRPPEAPAGSFVLAEAEAGLGVGESRAWRLGRAAAGWEGQVHGRSVRAWALAHDGAFESPGALREEDLVSGERSFYDAYPGSGGGRSTRALGALSAEGGSASTLWQATAWVGARSLRLDQNFTGWSRDPVHGDATRQTAAQRGGGARGELWAQPGPRLGLRGGAELRLDAVQQAEQGLDAAGQLWGQASTLDAGVLDGGAWLGLGAQPAPWLRVEPAVRGAVLAVAPDEQSAAWAPVLAPRLTVALTPEGPGSVVLSAGRGYRSADARAATPGGRLPVTTCDALELGGGLQLGPRLELRAAGFGSWLSDELVFDHLSARTLNSGATRRVGAYGGLVWSPRSELALSLDLTLSDGRFTATGEPIPYAPRALGVLGLSTQALPIGPVALTGGVRAWALAPRALPGGFWSRPTAAVDLSARVDHGAWSLELDVDNALGTRWRDGEYLYTSWWDTSQPRSELPARHFTAGAPFAARLSIGRRFG